MQILIEIAERERIPFTIFFNMGRGVSRRTSFEKLYRRLRRRPAIVSATKLSNMKKLGGFGYIQTVLANPVVGRGSPEVIAKAAHAGHECGLHGGRNHGLWQSFGASWSTSQIYDEVRWGLARMKDAGIQEVRSFSSPGWQGSSELLLVLEKLGFDLVADEHGEGLETVNLVGPTRRVVSVPTNICGEPGGVGYVEHLRARGLDDAAALADFAARLERIERFAVVYDHPYFAGLREPSLLHGLIRVAKDMGFVFTTLSNIAHQHR